MLHGASCVSVAWRGAASALNIAPIGTPLRFFRTGPPHHCRKVTQILNGQIEVSSPQPPVSATNRIACVVGHILRPAPHTGLAYKRSRKSPWSAWFWCISPKSSWLRRVLSVCVCGPISGCAPDLISPPPVMQPVAAADGHAGGAFDSAVWARPSRHGVYCATRQPESVRKAA